MSCGRVLFAAFVLLCLFSIAAVYMANKVEYIYYIKYSMYTETFCNFEHHFQNKTLKHFLSFLFYIGTTLFSVHEHLALYTSIVLCFCFFPSRLINVFSITHFCFIRTVIAHTCRFILYTDTVTATCTVCHGPILCTTLYSRTSNTNSKKAWQLIALIHSSNRY